MRSLRRKEDKTSSYDDSITDLPTEALMCTSMAQFSSKMKPILLAKLTAATSSEINSIITTKWRALKEARKQQAGQLSVFTAPQKAATINEGECVCMEANVEEQMLLHTL